ncbi:MAG: M23 family metallopeptidase, partial [Oscillospiraceae bacterium]|nr:M23 family metallopeptidase [Oscillospiraceae bacterium]
MKKSPRNRWLVWVLAGCGLLAVGLCAALGAVWAAGGKAATETEPAAFDPDALCSLFDAETESGIPLEILGGYTSAHGLGQDYTAAVGALGGLSEQTGDWSQRLTAWREALSEKGETKALAQADRLARLGRIRRNKVFPLPLSYNIDFADGYGEGRGENGTSRSHEGIDIFADYGVPVLSVCDGTIEKKGWLYLGGWRLGVRGTDDAVYYYYAHMSAYAECLSEGDTV